MPALYIAKRFLFSNKSQTLFIILGIAIGVSVQVFVGSLIQGLQISLVNRTIGNSSQVTIQPVNATEMISNYETIITEVKKVEGITHMAVARDVKAAVITGSTPITILVRGFVLEEANKIFKFIEAIYEGTAPQNPMDVIIGRDLQEELGIALNSVINISNPLSVVNQVKVVGFYDLGVAAVNKLWVITDFDSANIVFDFNGKVTSINMQVEDVFKADTLAIEIEKQLTAAGLFNNLVITNWKDENASLLSGLSGQSVSSYMIQVFVIISVLLAIASVLAITVMQKSKQLGILKAMGISDSKASQIFLFEGFMLGMLGGVVGVVLGIGLLYMFTSFAVTETGDPVVPIYFNWGFIVLSGVIATLASTFAALVPAKRSSKLSVIEVIRNG